MWWKLEAIYDVSLWCCAQDTPASLGHPKAGRLRLVLFDASLEQWLSSGDAWGAESYAALGCRAFAKLHLAWSYFLSGGDDAVGLKFRHLLGTRVQRRDCLKPRSEVDALRSWEISQFKKLADSPALSESCQEGKTDHFNPFLKP